MSLQSLKFFPACLALLFGFAVEAADTTALTEADRAMVIGSVRAALGLSAIAECADVTVLSSAYLGHREVLAECFGLDADGVRVFNIGSPFALEQRPIVYRPVGALSQATRARLEPALFAEVGAILAAHPDDKGLIHVASYEMGRRLVHDLAARAPRESRRLLWIDSAGGKSPALDHHRASPLPTVLVSPSLREGVDLPDDFLRFQVVTKLPYPDLGDPWTAARRARDPRWYAVETAKALVQAYGRSCRHAGDHGVTYVLDAQFARFLQHYRVLLPEWFLDAAVPAVRRLAGGVEINPTPQEVPWQVPLDEDHEHATYDPDQVPEPDLENPLKQQSGGGGVSAKPAWISSTTLRPIPATCIVLWCVYLGRLLLTIICDHEWMITRPSPMFARRPSHTEFGVARPRKQLRVVYARPQSNHYDMDLVRSLSDRRLLGGVHVLRPAFLK